MTSQRTRLQWRMLASTILLFLLAAVVADAQLSPGFYHWTCPHAASVVKAKVDAFVEADRGLAADLMRLHFHDCFVRGCDGSVLLDSTDPNVLTEKSALLNNNSLRGFEQIDKIKMELECACPGVVSCADILALVARDATVKDGRCRYPFEEVGDTFTRWD
ncbi:peroxidase [Marchantia polymorpha subsp. ruderalis]|uniref:Plant heme peroxidase family profile domain-containing protein n=2 Tax=Marchantia polymorpha TaxID=3197 RepID=A0AAF6BJA0_MARPO|nr:hypothetical protein MARPO_0182s0025 [Marchantia polymorpha]BBN12084.1 hypothetical protein Mp_5g17240 [Marchantia polymorpha subsp. ruderalis]|eukprot:PTQ27849.1 hypothetical protein MARPO_0182s0025 [Marchantia polymorpha]